MTAQSGRVLTNLTGLRAGPAPRVPEELRAVGEDPQIEALRRENELLLGVLAATVALAERGEPDPDRYAEFVLEVRGIAVPSPDADLDLIAFPHGLPSRTVTP